MSSDEEFCFDSEESNDEEFDFDSGSEDDNKKKVDQVDSENLFYEADDIRNRKPEEALNLFKEVVTAEKGASKQPYTQKALQNIISLSVKLSKYGEIWDYALMILNCNSDTASSAALIADQVDAGRNPRTAPQLVPFFDSLLSFLESSGPFRAWLSTAIRFGRLLEHDGDDGTYLKPLFARLDAAINDYLRKPKNLQAAGASEDAVRAAQLEVTSMRLQLAVKQGDGKAVRRAYKDALGCAPGQSGGATAVSGSFVADPKALAAVYAAGGRLLLAEQRYLPAMHELKQAFESFEASNNPFEAKRVLRLLVVAYVLATHCSVGGQTSHTATGGDNKKDDSTAAAAPVVVVVSPLEALEAKAHLSDPLLAALARLEDAMARRDVEQARRVLRESSTVLQEDQDVAPHLANVAKELQTTALVAQLAAVRRVGISKLASRFNEERSKMVDMLCMLNENGAEGLLPPKSLLIDEARDIVTIVRREVDSDRRAMIEARETWVSGLMGSLKHLSTRLVAVGSGEGVGGAAPASGFAPFERMMGVRGKMRKVREEGTPTMGMVIDDAFEDENFHETADHEMV